MKLVVGVHWLELGGGVDTAVAGVESKMMAAGSAGVQAAAEAGASSLTVRCPMAARTRRLIAAGGTDTKTVRALRIVKAPRTVIAGLAVVQVEEHSALTTAAELAMRFALLAFAGRGCCSRSARGLDGCHCLVVDYRTLLCSIFSRF